ncbi:CRISPR-associated protein Cas6 [Methylomarinovum tepidoasis]|uniref:CRISPR-associated protein Cas6 n=1 Tax=Methylomarinovum tepidoasis TaxID=2840183 RepID=A0AAU9CAI1_9GAMM|nr:CRISPR system precrRNA processing endoribonuclease RAMP protein Cas6 [Methylomarinovum sp. IN45]BCX88952.1 CRISPR-associated protein Cas6 [Methylomarinovum sp. IN45]
MQSPRIPLVRYRFHCRALDPIRLPHYAGSTWRGAFGHALKRTVCVTRMRDCRQCLLWRQCAYSDIFETPPPEDTPLLADYPAAPHPFIIHPEATGGGSYAPGQPFQVDLTLIGRANAQLPYIVHAWRVMGRQGVGKTRSRFKLEAVAQADDAGWRAIHREGEPLTPRPPAVPVLPPPPAERCRMVLETPLRIKHQGRLMGAAGFSFRGLIASLLRRLSLLQHFHGDGPLEADFRALVARAGAVRPLECDLRWYDWTRYSARQRTRMQMGGLLGWIDFRAEDLEPFWPWLAAGQWLHAGKGASMGLGRYRLDGKPAA